MLNVLNTYLEQIKDITDTFKPITAILDSEKDDIFESILLLCDDFLEKNILIMSDPYFHTTIFNELLELLYLQYENFYECDDYKFTLELEFILEEALKYYFTNIIPKRSYPKTFVRKYKPIHGLTKKIDYLKNIPQPEQRTKEWYEFRYNLLTASNAWKGLSTQSNINSLIYEKCLPLNTDKYNRINTSSPFHHGTIYEPISISVYEKKFKTKVEDFGCIKDKKYPFLGASPDGINIDESSPRYGRMLEVKNIVNREITGIPKKEYWIQMQIQMGVCDLNECDFLETKFTEYSTKEEFYSDGIFEKSHDNKLKGIFIYFIKDQKPYYEYPPIDLNESQFIEWEKSIMEKNKHLTWNKNIYWKLDILSCVLVLRNKKWFHEASKKLSLIWNTIEKERKSGYSHRAPNSNKKQNTFSPQLKPFSGCIINLDENNNSKIVTHNGNSNIQNSNSNIQNIIKIDTEIHL